MRERNLMQSGFIIAQEIPFLWQCKEYNTNSNKPAPCYYNNEISCSVVKLGYLMAKCLIFSFKIDSVRTKDYNI